MHWLNSFLQIAEKIIFESIVKKEPDSPSRATIVLNATSEFCRALGDIPTYGQAGNREEIEKDELEVSTTCAEPSVLHNGKSTQILCVCPYIHS